MDQHGAMMATLCLEEELMHLVLSQMQFQLNQCSVVIQAQTNALLYEMLYIILFV